MKTISEYTGQKILFIQPSVWKRFHELRCGEELLGTIQQKGFFGMRWEISIQNKNWEIYKQSCWRSALHIREAGYEMPMADFLRDGFRSKGTLKLPGGIRLKIAPHLFKGFCEITDEHEEQLVKIKLKRAFNDRAEVTIEKKSELIDKYPWIIILAYIVALEQKHQASRSAH